VSASLSGTVADDGLPTGSVLTTTWSKVSGPGTVTFASAVARVTTASFSTSGSYVLRLTASDGTLASADDLVITVNPAPPVTGSKFTGGYFESWYNQRIQDLPSSYNLLF